MFTKFVTKLQLVASAGTKTRQKVLSCNASMYCNKQRLKDKRVLLHGWCICVLIWIIRNDTMSAGSVFKTQPFERQTCSATWLMYLRFDSSPFITWRCLLGLFLKLNRLKDKRVLVHGWCICVLIWIIRNDTISAGSVFKTQLPFKSQMHWVKC
jgi:hypothetical protein